MTRRGMRSPVTAASLSLLFPGLGQYAAGARRRGVLIATPALVVLTALVGFGIGTVLGGGPQALVGLVLRPEVLVAVVGLDLIILAYHAFSILDAWLVARQAGMDVGRRTGRIAFAGLLVVLALATVGHGTVAALGVETEDTLTAVFQDDNGGATATGDWEIPAVSFGPDDDDLDASPAPTATPRAHGVLTGVAPSLIPTLPPGPDAAARPRLGQGRPPEHPARRLGRRHRAAGSCAPTRWSCSASTSRAARRPCSGSRATSSTCRSPTRRSGRFPDGRFPGLLNALYVYAWGHPGQFPGGEARGFRAITGAIQELVGVPLDGFVAVDLGGFVKLVNAVDGLWIRIPEPVYDDHYPKVDGIGLHDDLVRRRLPEAERLARRSSTPGPVTRTPTTAAWAASSSCCSRSAASSTRSPSSSARRSCSRSPRTTSGRRSSARTCRPSWSSPPR